MKEKKSNRKTHKSNKSKANKRRENSEFVPKTKTNCIVTQFTMM